jgi:hypothetical protein
MIAANMSVSKEIAAKYPKCQAIHPSGKPFHMTKGQALENRILFVESGRRRGCLGQSRLKKKIKKKWDIEGRRADEYIRRARPRLLIHLNQSKEEHRADSLAFYEGVQEGQASNVAEKLRARERIDKLLGLEQPMQIHAEISARPSGIAVDDLPIEQRRLLLQNLRNKKTIDIPSEDGE